LLKKIKGTLGGKPGRIPSLVASIRPRRPPGLLQAATDEKLVFFLSWF
jgi:hypothetical protein